MSDFLKQYLKRRCVQQPIEDEIEILKVLTNKNIKKYKKDIKYYINDIYSLCTEERLTVILDVIERIDDYKIKLKLMEIIKNIVGYKQMYIPFIYKANSLYERLFNDLKISSANDISRFSVYFPYYELYTYIYRNVDYNSSMREYLIRMFKSLNKLFYTSSTSCIVVFNDILSSVRTIKYDEKTIYEIFKIVTEIFHDNTRIFMCNTIDTYADYKNKSILKFIIYQYKYDELPDVMEFVKYHIIDQTWRNECVTYIQSRLDEKKKKHISFEEFEKFEKQLSTIRSKYLYESDEEEDEEEEEEEYETEEPKDNTEKYDAVKEKEEECVSPEPSAPPAPVELEYIEKLELELKNCKECLKHEMKSFQDYSEEKESEFRKLHKIIENQNVMIEMLKEKVENLQQLLQQDKEELVEKYDVNKNNMNEDNEECEIDEDEDNEKYETDEDEDNEEYETDEESDCYMEFKKPKLLESYN